VLRGHEHVELKQTGLAVHAYRRSLASQEREYRAWYGLGQAYELLKVPSRSLHYYRRATLLQPHDARMWCAVASCLETLGAKREAVRAYARALESENTRDPLALARLAALNTELGNVEQAAHYHKRHLDRRDEEQDDSQPTLEALLYLANYCKNAAKYTDAATYCSRLLDYPGKEKEEAKALLREIHALQSEESADSM
jgi:anaphase-promoting complex subunit 8